MKVLASGSPVATRARLQASSEPSSGEVSPDTFQATQVAAPVPVQLPQCPTGPELSVARRSLSRQGRAGAETVASELSGASGAVSGQILSQFRQGLCPYLAQATQNQPGDWSALNALREGLEQGQLDPVQFFAGVHQHYGDSVRVGDVLFESRPEVAEAILVATDGRKEQTFQKSSLQRVGMEAAYGAESLFLAGGAEWAEERGRLREFFDAEDVRNEAKFAQIMGTVQAHMEAWPLDQEIDLGEKLRCLTLDVGLQHMFSQQLSAAELASSAQLFERAGRRAADLSLGRQGDSDQNLDQELQTWAEARLQGRQPGGQPADLLQSLVDHAKDRAALRQEVITMAMLGHETTAALISSTVAELSQDRPWLEQLRAELGDQPATFANLGDQPSLKDGLREATRLHGPNYLLSREARQDVVVPTPQGPLALEAGTQVLMPMRPLNSDPDNEDFNAGRDGSKIYSFGAGNRVCAGQVLARLEAQLIVSELVRRFELTPVNAGAPQPLSDFSSRPADMRYRLTSRVPSPGA